MRAQAENLARIDTGLEVERPDGEGNLIELHGPQLDIIRLYDRPIRFIEDDVLADWHRIATIEPLAVGSDARVFGRADANFAYKVSFLVRLDEVEQAKDLESFMVDRREHVNPLAERVHKLLSDFHHVFHDRLELQTEDCPSGIVDHQTCSTTFDQSVVYPYALFVATVAGKVSAW